MTDNRENKSEYCSTTCLKCEPQYHRETKTHHYQDAIIKVPRNEIEEILRLSVCDDVRKIAGKWLKP